MLCLDAIVWQREGTVGLKHYEQECIERAKIFIVLKRVGLVGFTVHR